MSFLNLLFNHHEFLSLHITVIKKLKKKNYNTNLKVKKIWI